MSKMDKSLRNSFTWVLAGNAVYSACQWGIIPLIAKLGSPAKVGEYALGIAVSAPILVFANLQLRALVASDVKGKYSFGQYLRFRALTLGAALFVLLGISTSLQSSWYGRSIVLLLGLTQAFEWTSDTYYGRMQKFDRMDLISKSLMIKGPLSLLLLFLVMYGTGNLVHAVAGLTLGRLLVLVLYDSRRGFAESPKSERAAARPAREYAAMLRLLRSAVPLGLITSIAALTANIPRYFIEAHAGTRDLGIYSALASLISAGTLVISAFAQAAFTPVARACAQNNREQYRRLALHLACLGALLGCAGICAAAAMGGWILRVLFRPEYAEHAGLLVRLMMLGLASYVSVGEGYVLTAAGELNSQVFLQILSGLVTLTACAFLVPQYGIYGAADSAIAGAVVLAAGSAGYLVKLDRKLRTNRARASGGECRLAAAVD